MGAKILDGKAIANRIVEELRHTSYRITSAKGRSPGLAVLLFGDNPPSVSYVREKERACRRVGIMAEVFRVPANATAKEVTSKVSALNGDDRFDGILAQLPLPEGFSLGEEAILQSVSPLKDVDGLHYENSGRLLAGKPRFVPATPLGVQRLLIEYGVDLAGAHVVVVGRSKLAGMPLAVLLASRSSKANSTVTICHTGTTDLGAYTRQADILVSAVGRVGCITADMVRPGSIVVDVGINRVEDADAPRGYRLMGDVAYDEVAQVASAITPVPGGVGPMTVAMLIHNVLQAAGAVNVG